jgi:hypothetical protein
MSNWPNSDSLWLWTVTDYWNEQQALRRIRWDIQRILYFSVGNLQGSSPGQID